MIYDWKWGEWEPVQLYASNGAKIPLELPNQEEQDHYYPEDLGICTYPLDCCVEWRRPCNRCPHCERFWP